MTIEIDFPINSVAGLSYMVHSATSLVKLLLPTLDWLTSFTDYLQLDTSLGIGLNDAATDFFFNLGISWKTSLLNK